MQHSFDVEIARRYGILEAILLQNIFFWIEKNKSNGNHYYDNNYWTYNSNKAFAEMFPYSSEKQIRTALERLRKENILITGNYNKAGFDKTLWYAITDKGYLMLKGHIDLPHRADGIDTQGKPIPDINTDINNICSSDNEQESPSKEKELADNFDKIWKIYPRKDGKNTAFNHYKSWLRGKRYAGRTTKLTNRQMWLATKKYADYIKENKVEKQYIKMGSTFFNEAIMEYVEEEN